MSKKTIVIDSADREHFFLNVEAGTVRVGDSPEHLEGMAKNLRITRIHCEVEIEDERDSMPIDEPGVLAPRTLSPGSAVRLGHAQLSLVPAAPAMEKAVEPLSAPPSASSAAESPASPSMGHARWLRVVDGANHGRLFRLPETGTLIIGKSGKQADIGLDDMYVMKSHCSLDITGDRITVTHIEGAFGTLIDGQRINQPGVLKTGHVLRVGNSHLRLETGVFPADPTAPSPPSNDGSGVWRSLAAKPTVKSKTEDPLAALAGREFGAFQMGELLGRGHTGAVFAALNTKTGQSVALKVLAADFPASSAELEVFARELKSVQLIRHPNLIAQFSGGKTGAHCWIAREYVEGVSADAVIARIAQGEKPSWTRAARVAVHLARALDCLHRHRLVHGNLTPRNVLIQVADHAAKLADLRFAQATAGSKLAELVREKKRFHDLPYAAPEQADPDGFVDNLADLYGLGAITYALLTGRPPVVGKTADDIVEQIRTGWIPRPSAVYKKVPGEFDAAVMKLLARHQEDRFQTAEAALQDLESIARQHEIEL